MAFCRVRVMRLQHSLQLLCEAMVAFDECDSTVGRFLMQPLFVYDAGRATTPMPDEILLSDDDENLHRFVTALALTQRVEIMMMMIIEVNDNDALLTATTDMQDE